MGRLRRNNLGISGMNQRKRWLTNSTKGMHLCLAYYQRIWNMPQGTSALGRALLSLSPGQIPVWLTLVFFVSYTVAMRDLLCKVYNKLYCFLGYAEMRLILGYQSGGQGCARITFYIREGSAPCLLHLYRPLRLLPLKCQHHGKSL